MLILISSIVLLLIISIILEFKDNRDVYSFKRFSDKMSQNSIEKDEKYDNLDIKIDILNNKLSDIIKIITDNTLLNLATESSLNLKKVLDGTNAVRDTMNLNSEVISTIMKNTSTTTPKDTTNNNSEVLQKIDEYNKNVAALVAPINTSLITLQKTVENVSVNNSNTDANTNNENAEILNDINVKIDNISNMLNGEDKTTIMNNISWIQEDIESINGKLNDIMNGGSGYNNEENNNNYYENNEENNEENTEEYSENNEVESGNPEENVNYTETAEDTSVDDTQNYEDTQSYENTEELAPESTTSEEIPSNIEVVDVNEMNDDNYAENEDNEDEPNMDDVDNVGEDEEEEQNSSNPMENFDINTVNNTTTDGRPDDVDEDFNVDTQSLEDLDVDTLTNEEENETADLNINNFVNNEQDEQLKVKIQDLKDKINNV
ncbi:MAG: hypothetical protein IJ853_02960 [Rickettsiales bacterium]|nr:hypothetical protein [Rickettsiales bacterium]